MDRFRICRYLGLILLLNVCTLVSANVFAEEKPVVLWDNQVVYAVDKTTKGMHVADNSTCQAIGTLINDKIKSLSAVGRLPFKPVIVDDYQNNNIAAKLMAATSNYIALVPVVLCDSNVVRTINLHGKTWYRYEIITSLSLMFCAVGQEGVHIIYNMPMCGLGLLGNKFEHNLNNTNPIMNKIDTVCKKQFVYTAKQLIDNLSFPPEMANFLTESNLWKKTCQVDSVVISPVARKNIGSSVDVDNIPSIFAKAFTSEYAIMHPDVIMLPDRESGDAWKGEVARHINPNLSSAEFDETCNNSALIALSVDDYSDAITKQDNDFRYGVTNIVVRNLSRKKTFKMSKKFKRWGALDGKSTFQNNYGEIFSEVASELAKK